MPSIEYSNWLWLVWLCLALGGAGLALTICDYIANRLLTPKDEVPTSNPRVTRRLADVIEQEERLQDLLIGAGRSSEQSASKDQAGRIGEAGAQDKTRDDIGKGNGCAG